MRYLANVTVFCSILLFSAGAAPAAEQPAFVGSQKCKVCHLKEHKSWSETKMAKAFELLKPGVRADAKTAAKLDPNKDYTADPKCVKCHVTGLGMKGGFVDIASTPALAGVGCEVCHGAGGTYTQKEYMSLQNKEYKKAEVVAAGLVPELTEERCKTCHNSESPFFKPFDFAKRKAEGTHEKVPLKYKH